MVKPVRWLGSSRSAMRRAPDEVKIDGGYELYRLQLGQEPIDWKPMATVGPGTAEIRIHGPAPYRVLYVARFEEAVYVLHVFEKKRGKTSALDLETGRARYRELTRLRARERREQG